jgi:predicted kinase
VTSPVLIVVNGLSGTGKTGLARRLAEDLRLPCIGNDQLKEVLFDTLGWSDLEWSKRLGKTSSALLWSVTESVLEAGHSLVIESDFHIDVDAPRLRDIQIRLRPRIAEIHCYADREVLVQRVKERIERGDRHPGHGDQDRRTLHEEVIPELRTEPDHLLDAPDFYIMVDTTDILDSEYEDLRNKVRAFIAGEQPAEEEIVHAEPDASAKGSEAGAQGD